MSKHKEGTGLGRAEVELRVRTKAVPMVILNKAKRVYVRGETIPLAELEIVVLGEESSDSVSVLAGLTREQLIELMQVGQAILDGKDIES
jgi:hypothetical protein